MFIWALIKQGLGLSFIIGGLFFYGIYGLLWGCVIHSWSCTLINMSLVSRYIGYKITTQIADILPVMCVAVLAFLISYYTGRLLDLGLYGDGIVKFLVFIIIYLGWSFIFKPAPFTYISEIVISKIKLKKR
jgi:hypothetical protein